MYGQNPYQSYAYPSYNIPNYAQRQFMQAQPQMQQSSMQFEMPFQDIRYVTSEEAKAFIVMPNSKALLIDKTNSVAHLKTADNMGQSVTQYFKFEQVNADGSPLKPQEQIPQVDFAQFAKKEELNAFVTIEQYNTLSAKLDAIQKSIAGGKNNGNGKQ